MPVRPRDYSTYITQQWKKLAEINGINVQAQAVKELNILLLFTLDKLLDKSLELLEISGKAQLNWETVQTAMRFVMPEPLRIPAETFAVERVEDFKSNWESRRYPRKQRCSGLIFSLTVAGNSIRAKNTNVSDPTTVFLTAVCEYLCSDILDMMFVSHSTVYAAVSRDIDLQEFFKEIRFLTISHVRLSEEELQEYSRHIHQYTDAKLTRDGLITLKMYTDIPAVEDGRFLKRTIDDCVAVESLKKRKIITEETVLDVVRLHGLTPVR